MYRLYRSPTAPDKIYSSSMKTLCLGHGMWYPEPHKSGEIQIGDVGFLKAGAFVRLFNLDTSAPGKAVTHWDEPFDVSNPPAKGVFKVNEQPRPLAPGLYPSKGVQSQHYRLSASVSPGPAVSAGISGEYICKTSQGAVLAFKSDLEAQGIYENIELKRYVLQHHDIWCTYVKETLHQSVKPSAIVMISGWVKTSPDWAVAAFKTTSSSSSVSVKTGVVGVAGGEIGAENAGSVVGPTMLREGVLYDPKDPGSGTPGARDQAIFVNRFKVRRRLGFVRAITAGAGYHRLPRKGGGRENDGEEHIERGMDFDEGKSEDEIPDLVDILLEYMFETTAIEMAVASDDDVACIVGEDSVEDFESYLRNRQPPVEVDGSDLPVGFFRKESIIRHQREQDAARRAITRADWIKWPNITMEGASKSDDIEVFFEPIATDTHSVKLMASTFIDPQHPSNGSQCFSLSPDGKLLAASFRTSSILLWRLLDGILVQRLHHNKRKQYITCLAFSPDSTEIFTGDVGKMVTAWNIRTGTIRLSFGLHEGEIVAIACSPYEPYVCMSTREPSSLYVWDRLTGRRLATFSNSSIDHVKEITFLSPTFDTSNVYARSLNFSFIDNIRSCTRLRSIVLPLRNLTPGRSYVSRSVSHRGDRILVMTVDQGLQILDAHSGELQIAIPNSENLTFPVGFSASDKEIYATCKDDNAAQSFDSTTGDVRYRYELSGKVGAGAYSPDGAYLALCTADGEVQVHDPESGTFLAKARMDRVYSIAFTRDSQRLIADGGDLRLLNVSDMVRAR